LEQLLFIAQLSEGLHEPILAEGQYTQSPSMNAKHVDTVSRGLSVLSLG
jgi:hypothetical protein